MMLLYAFAVVVAVNCIYFILFSKFSFLKAERGTSSEIYSVSLIVCAKNEAENLRKNIPIWLAQNHPKFEIILINDASSDSTLEVMNKFAAKDDRIQVVDVENNEAFWGNKKYALTLGIKRAQSKRMLFTDADCRPASNDWISEMVSHFNSEKHLVLGYGGYEKKSGPLNALIRFETAITAIQYFSYAKAGIPYMGVGRNMAYTSPIYYENKGFISHINIASGDDDLFVNENATAHNTAICFTPQSFTYSYPKTTLREWLDQKRRHITTAKYYKFKHKLLLSTYYIFNLAFWLLLILSFSFSDWIWTTTLVGFRILIQWIVIGKAASNLEEKNLIPFIPILDLFLVCLQLTIFISNTLHKPNTWK